MTLAHYCSKCGVLLETTNADPLIEAAPDLLAALKAAEYFFQEDFPDGVDGPCAVTRKYREAYRAMLFAIAKATGAHK
jgi:hypothetical protein